jgi:hypothetical protein
MKRPTLKSMTIDQLVRHFEGLALEQDKALLGNEISKVNRIYDRLKDVEDELRGREGDQRGALLALYDHPNPQVRVKAVKATLAVEPDAARRMLKVIAESREFPQAGEAGMSIRALERGIFKPS